jgi:hypothetical protein
MQALPSGALGLFPKLEVLQIILAHEDFSVAVDEPDGEDIRVVANTLAVFLTSEARVTLCQVCVDCSFCRVDDGSWGAIRFLAARHGGLWDVKVKTSSTSEASITAQFDDILAEYW